MRNDPLARNPFHVLAVAPTASRAEIERQGQKLIGLLELGLSQARAAATPLGSVPRHADDVRWALGELREPDRRLAHELWAALSPKDVAPPPPAPTDEALAPWSGAGALVEPRPGLTVDLFALFALFGGAASLGPVAVVNPKQSMVSFVGATIVLSTVLVPVVLWRLITRWLSPQVVHRLGTIAGHESADAPGLAALAAAQVSLARDRGEDERAWVEQTIAASKLLRSGGVVASALLTARRGDVDGALGLLRSAEQLRTRKGLPVAFRVARERRAVLAAGRGDWAEVAAVAALPGRACTSRLTRLLGAVARRLLRRPDAPSDRQLRWLHAVAPHRALTSDLLARALGVAAVSHTELPHVEVTATSSVGPLPVEPWAQALGRLAYARLGRPTLGDLVDLGAAFDAALASTALAERIELRAREVGATPGRMLGQLRDEVTDEIARAADAGDWPVGSLEAPGLTLERASRKLRDLLLAGIEPTSEATKQRVLAERALPPVDEWREALALWQRYERLGRLAGPMARRLAWPHVRADLGKLAVWLWNKRGERTIAHTIFTWLLDEARALDDSEAIALQQKNVECGF